MELKRQPNETLEQYLWRVGTAKDNGQVDLTWPELAEVINPQFFDDEDDYIDVSAFRKRYSTAKRFYEDVFSKMDKNCSEERHAEMLSELRQARQKLSDERTSMNRIDRNASRIQADLEHLEEVIKSTAYRPLALGTHYDSEKDMIVCLSDIHYGLEAFNSFGSYNSDIARSRMAEYLDNVIDILKRHQCRNVYLICLGDLLSGATHPTVRLENRENVIEQIQGVSELIANFIYMISQYAENVIIKSVAGNHSRIMPNKEDVLRDERLDDLIPWYLKAKLSNLPNVKFEDHDNYDPTLAAFNIRGKEYCAVHGDVDSFSESGISKLVMMIGYKPEAVFFGHLHHNSMDTISDIKLIRSGCFSGCCDNYTISKRISGSPSQMVAIVSQDGVETLYPITLA